VLMRPKRVFVVVAVPLLLAALAPSAAASCNPQRANDGHSYFAGTQRTPSAWPRAVQTQIEEYSPYVLGPSQVTAWNMLNNGGTKWSQVGWWKDDDGTRTSFIQWTDAAGNFWTRHYSPAALGTTPNYETIYDKVNTDWIWERNNTVLHTTNAVWQPATIQIYGEINTRASQMPGGVNNHVALKEAHYIPNNGNQWLDMASLPGATDAVIHAAAKLSNEYYEIWDKACGS
jgi:hypothetical protein